jgi:hypothetical protein
MKILNWISYAALFVVVFFMFNDLFANHYFNVPLILFTEKEMKTFITDIVMQMNILASRCGRL